MARRLEEWREERRRKKELHEEWRLTEEIRKRRQAKVQCVVTYCVFLVTCWCRYGDAGCCLQLQHLTYPSMKRFCQEERSRQLGVKFTIEERRRFKRKEEEEQSRKTTEEEKKEMEERRRAAAKGIKLFNERVRIN